MAELLEFICYFKIDTDVIVKAPKGLAYKYCVNGSTCTTPFEFLTDSEAPINDNNRRHRCLNFSEEYADVRKGKIIS